MLPCDAGGEQAARSPRCPSQTYQVNREVRRVRYEVAIRRKDGAAEVEPLRSIRQHLSSFKQHLRTSLMFYREPGSAPLHLSSFPLTVLIAVCCRERPIASATLMKLEGQWASGVNAVHLRNSLPVREEREQNGRRSRAHS